MKIRSGRPFGFLFIIVVYIMAMIVGIAIYRALPYAYWLDLLIADVVATLVVFVFSTVFGNASVYDPYWSVQPIVILVGLAFTVEMTLYRLLILTVVCLWGVRLTANWAYTFHGLDHQDWRYAMLDEKTGAFYPVINLLGIHMVPTLVVYGCTLPAAYAFLHPLELVPTRILFLCLSVAAIMLQTVADLQMQIFRRSGKGGFIRQGVWRHSRHPNYLGEIVMWWGIALSVIIPNIELWYFTAGTIANSCLFAFVSIPMAEARQAKKPGFAQYKKETRVLLPVKK